MDGKVFKIEGAVAINLLNIMRNEDSNSGIKCQLILLECGQNSVLVAPVLDYLSDDAIIVGISVSNIDAPGGENIRSALVDRQKHAGYRSHSWEWKHCPIKAPADIEIAFSLEGDKHSFPRITSSAGNLLISGLEPL